MNITGLSRILGSEEPDQPGASRTIKVYTRDGDASERMEDISLRGGGLFYPCEKFTEYMNRHGDTDGFVAAGDWLHPSILQAYRIEPTTEIRMCVGY